MTTPAYPYLIQHATLRRYLAVPLPGAPTGAARFGGELQAVIADCRARKHLLPGTMELTPGGKAREGNLVGNREAIETQFARLHALWEDAGKP